MPPFLIVREQQNTIAYLPSDPVKNANLISSQKQKFGLDGDMQRGLLDGGMKGSNGPRICNPDGIRLRGVSELRSRLFFRISARLLLIFLPSFYVSCYFQICNLQCYAIKLLRYSKRPLYVGSEYTSYIHLS